MDSLIHLLSQWIQILLSQRWFLLPFQQTKTTNQAKRYSTKFNAPVIVNSKIIDTAMHSVQESETVSGFINCKDSLPLRNALHKMYHIQGQTPIQFENIVVNSIITYTVVQRRYKDMDVHFYLISYWCIKKTISCSSEASKTWIFPTIHQNIILHNITFQFDQLMYSIPSQNKQKLYLNDQNYQLHCKFVYKHICHKTFNNRQIKNIQCHQYPFQKCWTNRFILHVKLLRFPR